MDDDCGEIKLLSTDDMSRIYGPAAVQLGLWIVLTHKLISCYIFANELDSNGGNPAERKGRKPRRENVNKKNYQVVF